MIFNRHVLDKDGNIFIANVKLALNDAELIEVLGAVIKTAKDCLAEGIEYIQYGETQTLIKLEPSTELTIVHTFLGIKYKATTIS